MKDLFKMIAKSVLIVSLILLFSCEKDLYEESIKNNNNGKSLILRGKEAEKVAQRLNNLLGSRSSLNNNEFAKTITLDIGTINYEEILKIIDSYGKENYTFEIRYPIQDEKKFGNLILQEKDNYTTIKLIEYYMTDAFAQEFKLNYDLKQFKGNIKFLPVFTDNPCPDPEVIIQIGNVPANCTGCGGSGGYNNSLITGGNTIPNGGSDITPDPIAVTITDGDDDQDSSEENIGIGNWILWDPPKFGKLSIVPITPIDPTAPVDPCPPNTEIGILYPVDKCSKSFLTNLDNSSRQWLYAHNDEHNAIMEYISKSPNCGEASILAKEILKEQKRGSKVDFENKIIIDSSFVVNQKAMCVYNKMKGNTAFKTFTAPFDIEKPVAFVKLKAGPVVDNERAQTNPPDSNNIIEITINNNPTHPNGINAQPNLFLCQTIMHEIIHAELFRRIIEALGSNFDGVQNLTIVNALEHSDYQVLAGYFAANKFWSHNYMAEQFRKAIGRVTQEFATGTPVVGNPENIYTLYAWRGLDLTNVVSWYTIPPPIQNEIHDTIDDYINNHSNESCE